MKLSDSCSVAAVCLRSAMAALLTIAFDATTATLLATAVALANKSEIELSCKGGLKRQGRGWV